MEFIFMFFLTIYLFIYVTKGIHSKTNTDVLAKCLKCNQVVNIGDNFCASCGASIYSVKTANCVNCNQVINIGDNFCTSCGTKVNNSKILVTSSSYDPIFKNTEDKLLEEFINKQMIENGSDLKSNLIPKNILKRKNILNIIFSVLVFIYVCLIFFHFPLTTYLIGLIILIIFFKYSRKYNLMAYLKKEIKARPSEKISNIVMNTKNSFVNDSFKKRRIICIISAIIIPMIIFINPIILYEKVEDGYAVRFYAFGLSNFKTATIPEKYKGENVVSLRGNTFSNMLFLKTVTLPNTITEIRGQAFKNDINLSVVNIPNKLEYLGGGAFYNCSSITSIVLPDTLTYMGGEVFYGATSLKSIKLSNSLTEIKGNSFENCSSLESIDIPDSITRIAAHAFYGNTSLSEVNFSEYSNLNEIGSSAFRRCSKLTKITLPKGVNINSKAFKESPTVIYRIGDLEN